jgi:hypothetical protein
MLLIQSFRFGVLILPKVKAGPEDTLQVPITSSETSYLLRSKVSLVDEMLHVLHRLVEMKTVSVDPQCMTESRKAAKYLKHMMIKFGAEVQIVSF